MYRIGNGYDIHKLTENRSLILGGIKIPFEKGLAGHSDADVLIHSIIDGLLGASSLGDIGKLFPDTENKYKNADSRELLKIVYDKVKDKYEIVNIDNTIICEKPKLSNYIQDIHNNLCALLEITPDQISIKAKTNEGLDSIGNGKAIAVFSSVLLRLND